MANSAEIKKIITSSLYEDIPLDDDLRMSLCYYFNKKNYNDLSVDMYCPSCGDKSTFKPCTGLQLAPFAQLTSHVYDYANAFFENELPFGILYYACARDCNHKFIAQITYDGTKRSIRKIGQNLSVADIDAPEFNKFRKVLPKEKLSDLKRSVGLVSHGIGAGSFVYLRRVFEYLLNDAYDKAIKAGEITSEEYEKARVVERIKMLKNYLPDMMVENAAVYGILSKGVHELDEETCIQAYSLMKNTIVEILEDLLAKREKEERRKALSKDINQLHSTLKAEP